MIAQLRGRIVGLGEKLLIVDVGGVGYGVQVPETLLSSVNLEDEISLVTYHHVKENAIELYGFGDNESKQLFEWLIGVSGVGPKSAMAVMSLGPQDRIRQAIASGDTAYIAAASGVGKRSAERICNELKDKVGLAGLKSGVEATGSNDALEALLSLGYNRQQAVEALNKIDSDLTSEDKVKLALKTLS